MPKLKSAVTVGGGLPLPENRVSVQHQPSVDHVPLVPEIREP